MKLTNNNGPDKYDIIYTKLFGDHWAILQTELIWKSIEIVEALNSYFIPAWDPQYGLFIISLGIRLKTFGFLCEHLTSKLPNQNSIVYMFHFTISRDCLPLPQLDYCFTADMIKLYWWQFPNNNFKAVSPLDKFR